MERVDHLYSYVREGGDILQERGCGQSMSEVPEGFEMPEVAISKIRQSASLLVTRDGSTGVEILFCHRVSQMPSFPNFWAFPGGGVNQFDRDTAEELSYFPKGEDGSALVALMREMVEEVGWAPSEDGLVMVSSPVRDLVVEDGNNWYQLVDDGQIPINPEGFQIISIRTTPPLTPMRFTNRFFHLHDSNPPTPTHPNGRSEFDEFCWLTPKQALEEWIDCRMRIPPPQITLLRNIISALSKNEGDIISAMSDMATQPQTGEHRIEFAPGVECVPLSTYTLPPATHTNCYIVGNLGSEYIVVDPAAREKSSLEYLERRIRAVEKLGGRIIATVFTHKHPDHIGDMEAISRIYQAPIWASEETLETLTTSESLKVLAEGDTIILGDKTWHVLETPGHCPGHLCLSSDVGMITGDMAVMVGTILVPPSDGDMEKYITSLERIRDEKPPMLFPAHGPLSPVPEKLLERYIKHRNKRHALVFEAVKNGLSNISEIADYAYKDTPEAHPFLKTDQTLSHLLAHERRGDVVHIQDKWYLAE